MSFILSVVLNLVLVPGAAAGPGSSSDPVAAVEASPAQVSSRIGSELTIAQLQYGGGGDWYANPSGLPNLLRAIRERTSIPVSDRPARVQLTDAALWRYP